MLHWSAYEIFEIHSGGSFLIAVVELVSFGTRVADTNPAGATSTNSLAAAKPVPYPLDACIISGDKFDGDMGPPVVFVYQDAAKPKTPPDSSNAICAGTQGTALDGHKSRPRSPDTPTWPARS